MVRVVKIALIAVAAVILLVAAGMAISLAALNHDNGRLASFLIERATGRAVVVNGRFAIHPSLRPSLVMSQVQIANPPWASKPDLARIGHLEVQVPLWPLLSGALVFQRLILNDAAIALERSADGATNWRGGSDGADLGLVPVFGTVRMRNVEGRYRDDASGHETAVRLARLTLQDTGAAGELDARGTWDGQEIAARGTLGTVAEALHPSRPFPLDLAVSLPGLDVGVRGTIAEPTAGRGLDLRLVGRSDDLGPFLERLDSQAPLAGPAEGEATLRGDFDAIEIPDLRLSLAGGPSPEKGSAVQARGAIASLSPERVPLLDGIALQVQGTTATAALSNWLGRPLPDVGAIAGRVSLSGNSDAVKVSDFELKAGGKGGPSFSASGDIEQLQLAPGFALRGADLQLEAATPDLAAVGTLLDVALPQGAFSYHGRLSGDPDKLALSGEARLGDTSFTQIFAGSVAGAPPRLEGELSVALAGLQLTARGAVADPMKGRGLDLRVVGQADDVAPLLALLGRKTPGGRMAAQATIGGDLEALRVTDLRLSLAQAPGSKSPSTLQATGQIASVSPRRAAVLDGIALEIQGTTSTGVLAGWLGRPLPDLGPVEGRFTLTGSSQAVRITGMKLQAGRAERLSIVTTGGIGEIRPGPVPTIRSADLTLDAKAPDSAVISALLDASLPRLGALAYTGRLSGDPANWGLTGKVRVGRTVIDEDLTGSYTSPRPRISGKLSIPTLYVADFGIISESKEIPHRASSGPWQQAVAALSALDTVDLALSIELDRVEGSALPIGQGKVDLTLEDGVLRIDPARFGFVAGTTLVHATANARAQPAQADLGVRADDVQLGEVVTAMGGTPPLTGELALLMQLQSSGDSAQELLSSLHGETHFALQRGEVDLSVNLATADLVTWLLAGAQRGTRLLRGKGGRTKLECLVGRFTIEHGLATAQSLVMTTPLTLSTATGTINLVDQTIDLVVRLRARRASTFDPATTYRLHGPMADPALDYSRTGFVARAIANLVMKPLDALGALLPLVADNGGDPSNPCLSAES